MNIFRDIFFRVLATFIFACGYHMMYIEYLNPMFEYAHYRLVARNWIEWGLIYIIILIPAFWQQKRNDAIATGISLIYLLLYVPGLITMSLMWILPFTTLAGLAISLLVGQLIIQFSTPFKNKLNLIPNKINESLFNAETRSIVIFFTSIAFAILMIENRGHMELVGFDDVYDLRFASRDSRSVLGGYIGMWLLGVSVPYFLAVAVTYKSLKFTAIAVTLSVLIYMTNGAKSALLMPIQGLIVGLLVQRKMDSTFVLASYMALLTWMLFFLDFEWLNLTKSLFLMRLLSTGGWTMTTYYEFFSENGFTYYSHVGPIGALIGKSYNLELGQLIGREYSQSLDANFNANFWATDGIAALGYFGIIIASITISLILRTFSNISQGMDQRAIAIFLSGLWLSLLNASIFTSMLSGGGFLLFMLLYFNYRKNMKKSGAVIFD